MFQLCSLLIHGNSYPYNAEARLRQLTDSWITPVGKHFVRNHCNGPPPPPRPPPFHSHPLPPCALV